VSWHKLNYRIRQKKYYDRRTKVRTFEKGDEVLVLLPTDSNKLLLQWKGPFEILERDRGDDYRIQLVGRTKTFHANMLKKYWSRDHEDRAHVSHAIVFEPEGGKDELSLFTSSQTETYKDVKVNPELTEEQRGEVMKVLEEFQDVFTDVPGLTNLGKHSITLTTEGPIHFKPYSLPHAVQKEVEKELDDMLKEGIREPSKSSDVVFVVIIRKSDGSNKVCVDFSKLDKVTMFDPKSMSQKVIDPFGSSD